MLSTEIDRISHAQRVCTTPLSVMVFRGLDLLDDLNDPTQHAVSLRSDLQVRETQDRQAKTCKIGISFAIIALTFRCGVAVSIHLDHQASLP